MRFFYTVAVLSLLLLIDSLGKASVLKNKKKKNREKKKKKEKKNKDAIDFCKDTESTLNC